MAKQISAKNKKVRIVAITRPFERSAGVVLSIIAGRVALCLVGGVPKLK